MSEVFPFLVGATMSRFRISTRLYLLVGLSLLVVTIAMIFNLSTTASELLEERKTLLQTVDQVALSIVEKKFAEVKSGALSEKQAQEAALQELAAVRYGETGYLWVNDLHQVVLMHPIKPELNGKDVTDMKDPDGKALWVEFVKVAKEQKSGFVDYRWPKPGIEKPVPKLSHVALFEPWGWVIGNGVYIDDLDAKFWHSARQAFVIAGIGSLFMVLGAFLIIRSVTSPIQRLRTAMNRIAEEDFAAEVADVVRGDEVGDMARTLVSLRDSVNERVQARVAASEEQRALIDRERGESERLRAQHAENLGVVVSELGAGLARLAECNISITIDEPFPADFEPLRKDFNNSIATFQATLEEVLQQTRALQENGQEMHHAADNLAKRTEQQAAALEQTSAALEQVTATVKASSLRTQDTRKLVSEAKDCAATSGRVVREAVDAMHRIETASREINQIIGVIDEIAFQTNLLALNAGVEAARAGEAGKGFAVVAQEVRELAQRSAKAAKEIKGLIVNSANEVSSGVRLVGETGSALDSIQGFVSAIDDNVDAIATASTEQALGLQQISAAVNDIDQMTQQNAAMVEETTAVSYTLAEGSGVLASLVGRFKLNRRSAIREPGSAATDSRRQIQPTQAARAA